MIIAIVLKILWRTRWCGMSSNQMIKAPNTAIRTVIMWTNNGPVTPPIVGAAIVAARNAANRPPERRFSGDLGLAVSEDLLPSGDIELDIDDLRCSSVFRFYRCMLQQSKVAVRN
jgi:hypothetical protein